MSRLEIDDTIVLLLGAPTKIPSLNCRLSGVTRLEKLVFLIERETRLKDLLDEDTAFIPYNFGPFSAPVYKAVDSLVAYGLLDDSGTFAASDEDSWEQNWVIGVERPDRYTSRNFILTEKGQRYYDALLKEVPKKYITELARFKEHFGPIPLRQLVRYVYLRYPDMTDRSLIREEVLGNG